MNAIKINKHEGLRHELRWMADGQPFDITGMTITIVDAAPQALMQGTVEVSESTEDSETWGKAILRIPGALFNNTMLGRTCWVRLGLVLSDGELDTTPPIWIEIE